jgi:hypothetical protein
MFSRRNAGKGVESYFHLFMFVLTVEDVGMSGYFHSHPARARSVRVGSSASLGKPMKQTSSQLQPSRQIKTN